MNIPEIYDPQIINKGWGSELLVRNNSYCGKILRYNKDATSSFHFHVSKTETFFILRGKVLLSWTNPLNGKIEQNTVESGKCIHLNRGTTHQITAVEETDIMEISSYDMPEDTYRIQPGDSQK